MRPVAALRLIVEVQRIEWPVGMNSCSDANGCLMQLEVELRDD